MNMFMQSYGMSKPVAKRLLEVYKRRSRGEGNDELYDGHEFAEVIANVPRYLSAGRKPTRLEEWVEQNRHEFDG